MPCTACGVLKAHTVNSKTYQSAYNGVILPAMRGGFRLLSLASPKIRVGLRGRNGLSDRVREFRRQYPRERVVLFHCASAGEMQALKPFVGAFKDDGVKLAVSFFSPSAQAALERDNPFDFADYSPADMRLDVNAYLEALRPEIIAITKHDVWPNFVWTAKDLGIPIFLMNGNFHPESIKQLPGIRSLHHAVYSAFTEIMVVSEEDARNARQVAGDGVVVSVIGDSRFDQVLRRVWQHPELPPELVTACAEKKVLVAGSTHGDDEELLIPAVAKLAQQDRDMLTLIIPHDPSPAAKRRVETQAARYGLSVSDLDANGSSAGASAILVNRTGMLADLYELGRVAYVGGGFGKGVHSVLEPLAHRLPVITGPHINVSYEARTANQLGIVTVVRGRRRFEANVRRWFYDDAAWEDAGQRADRFVSRHSGATQRIAERLREALSERA